MVDFGLTDREKKVIDLAASGFENGPIADVCTTSEHQIALDWLRIRAKLGAVSKAAAIAIWRQCVESEQGLKLDQLFTSYVSEA